MNAGADNVRVIQSLSTAICHDRDMARVDLDTERQIRIDAMAWLQRQRDVGKEFWTQSELAEYEWMGEPIALMDRQRGIRKPAIFNAALSIRTVYRAAGQERPYEDGLGSDQMLRYKWRGSDPQHAENRALRSAMMHGLPVIYFDGFAPSMYAASFPVYLVAEEQDDQQFVLALGEDQLSWSRGVELSLIEKLYRERMTLQRLHQPKFRASVMRAYEQKCAICTLRHSELLDAAHIIGDRASGGDPVVSNGLSLCKIHHAAYDANIIGVRPDLEIEVNATVLEEVDGPMLRFGIQGIHGQRLSVVPRVRSDQPDPHRLATRFERFREHKR